MNHRGKLFSCRAALALLVVASADCPRPGPSPERPPLREDVVEPVEPDAGSGVEAYGTPAPDVVPEPIPAVPADPRFEPLPGGAGRAVGTPPTIVETHPPDGDRSPAPDVGAASLASLQAQFGCETIFQVQWPASWLSPEGVVLRCCNRLGGGARPPEDGFVEGCMVPFACSLLIDEGIGAVTKVETIMDLRRRVSPVRDPRAALAVVAATVRDVVPFFGDADEERRFVREGPWNYTTDSIEGTRVTARPGVAAGYGVTTFVRRGCGCRHDLEEVELEVTDLAGVTELSRRTVIEDASGLCVD